MIPRSLWYPDLVYSKALKGASMTCDHLTQKTFFTPRGTITYWVSTQSSLQSHPLPHSQSDSQVQDDNASRPWLIFLPGLTANHRLFEKQVEYFIDRANILVWDPPSHGLSRPFNLTWTLDDLATWLHDICEQEHIERPILIGQSMGGYTAQVFMELYPSCAKGFISIDSCPLQKQYYSGWELAALHRTKLMYLSIPWKTLVRLGSKGNAVTPYAQNIMRDMMLDYQKREYCELAAHGFTVLADAVEANRPYIISCPYLLICGEEDKAGSAKRYNRAWEKNTGTQVHWIPNAGHNSNGDNPIAINKCIEAFINSLDRQ